MVWGKQTICYTINNTLIGRREVDKKIKLQTFKSIYLPTTMCGAKIWTILDKHASRVTSVEIRFLKQIMGRQWEIALEMRWSFI